MKINHFSVFSIFLSCLFYFVGVCPVTAQTSEKVDTANLQELVTTLENDAKRIEFINNLKTMIETYEKQQAAQDAQILAELTALEQMINKVKMEYRLFLAEIGLDESVFGRLVAMIAIVIMAFVAAYLWRRFYFYVHKKLINFQQRFHLRNDRLQNYLRWVRLVGYWGIFLSVLYGFAFTWDIMIIAYFIGEEQWLGFIALSSKILVITTIAVLLWEIANGIAEYVLLRADMKGRGTRMKTMLPIIRSLLTLVVGAFFLIAVLSEIGINVMPLLAGAGVVGIAVGFGAQKMVMDFLTGFTILAEDLIQVGDVATVAGKSGTVEKITTRKIQLRDGKGTVVTIPFSEVKTVENQTRNFGNYPIEVAVNYNENPDEIIEILRSVGDELINDKDYSSLILAPINIMGVDRFTDTGLMIIKASIKTSPAQQSKVGREFNRRMKMAFARHDVQIPTPMQTNIYVYLDKDGVKPITP